MEIHLPKAVAESREFYAEVLARRATYASIGAHLEAMALRMWEGLQAGNDVVFMEISGFHRDHLGRSPEVLRSLSLKEADCRQAIANEYGFSRWTEVAALWLPYDMLYEETVDLMLAGEIEQLKERIGKNPALLQQKSRYGHRATLLHYAVGNGVEIWRQQLPMNLPDIVGFLLEKGASPWAKMQVYGGEYTAAELLLSSMHPRNAGIFEELRSLLDT